MAFRLSAIALDVIESFAIKFKGKKGGIVCSKPVLI